MVNPGFAGQSIVPSTIKKAEKLNCFLNSQNKNDITVEVDGNITTHNAHLLKGFGASIFVAGSSSVFSGEVTDLRKNIKNLKQAISE